MVRHTHNAYRYYACINSKKKTTVVHETKRLEYKLNDCVQLFYCKRQDRTAVESVFRENMYILSHLFESVVALTIIKNILRAYNFFL